MWQKFTTSRGADDTRLEDERTEIACALMMGARFIKGHADNVLASQWTCVDDNIDAGSTGYWTHKTNAARAYLTHYGVFFDREGNPLASSPVPKR